MNLILSLALGCGGGAPEAPVAEAPASAPATPATPTTPATPATPAAPQPAAADYSGEAWEPIGDGIPTLDESGATTTETGLTIITISEGTGALPEKGKKVSVHYHGWLASDGSNFDSSSKSGKPLTFPVGVGMVIPGWDEGILAIKEGGKARLRIPGNLAYGERSPTPKIPPNSDLVFDVWLVKAGS
jgi:peptidylprolyl isomerase